MGLKDEHAAKYDNQLREEESLLCCVRSSVVILFLLKSVEKNFIFKEWIACKCCVADVVRRYK